MGLHRLGAIAESLMGAGKPRETPVCVVSHATRPSQKTVTGSLNDIAALAAAAELHAPSLVIVGECVRQRQPTDWFQSRPLFGKVIGITRPEDQADEAARRAVELGASPVMLPTIEIAPPENWDAVDAMLSRISDFHWIVFTSVNGVRGLLGICGLWAISDSRLSAPARRPRSRNTLFEPTSSRPNFEPKRWPRRLRHTSQDNESCGHEPAADATYSLRDSRPPERCWNKSSSIRIGMLISFLPLRCRQLSEVISTGSDSRARRSPEIWQDC